MKTFMTILFTALLINAQTKLTDNTFKYDSLYAVNEISISEFSILSGEWIGEAFGGVVEEYWSQPSADGMIGSFKLNESDTTVFTEFFQLLKIDGVLQLRLKHFTNRFIGWEEKDDFVTFEFIKNENNRLYFDGLTYERNDENNLTVYLVMHNKDKSVNEIIIKLRRKYMDESEVLLNADKEFAKLSLDKGAAIAFKEYLAEDAKQFPAGSLPVIGNENIFNGMKDYNESHVLEWEPQEAEVSVSGDMGYSWGFYKSYSKSEPEKIKEGKYVNVWKKIDGKWKVIVDIGNSN